MQITDGMEWRSRKEETGMRDTARQMRSAMMCDRMRQMSMCDGMDADVVRLFPDYFSEITYYPADQFSDGIHFGRPYNTKEVYREKLRELYLDRGYLDGFQI